MIKIYSQRFFALFAFLIIVLSCRGERENGITSPPIQIDAQNPAVPQNLSASAITKNSFTLSWSSSTDNVGVLEYIVNVNNITITSKETTLKIKDLNASTLHQIHVKAKDAAGNISDASSSINVTTLSGEVDVYVSGYSQYWKNGISNVLQTSNDFAVFGHAIFVAGDDVYNSGYVSKGTIDTYRRVAAYWKNGNLNFLEPSNSVQKSSAEDIAVNGNDIYAVGSVSESAPYRYYKCYWKNGVKTTLPNSGNTSYTDPAPSTIKVENNDVYIASSIWNNFYKPVYWKNGIMTQLSYSSNISAATVRCMDVENGDVYIGASGSKIGNVRVGFYWKNNVINELIDCEGIYCIDVIGDDIYVGGNTSSGKVAYWKNGIKTEMPFGRYMTGLKVIDNDVYALIGKSSEYDSSQKVYKNGIELLNFNNVAFTNLFVLKNKNPEFLNKTSRKKQKFIPMLWNRFFCFL
ncbi:fibronectin type III domain-containing protein [Chryseobacterium sp. MP_3.2]|uniref:fibronectin type III domain-containing protein n=1 Tax=Chryseobacterium sp. MP_3.2 TaxID=3071712 RepID=UPI002DFBCBCB|nr:hypothetical protein [Chryseobacterium sp. MP_3.2]